MSRLKITLLYVAVIFGAVIAGLYGGEWLGAGWARARQSSNNDAEMRLLYSNLVGIREGHAFPLVDLWDTPGGKAQPIEEILPKGGLVVIASLGCDPCIARVKALQEAINAAGGGARAAIIVADGAADFDSLVTRLRGIGIGIPVYVDVTESFRRVHNVVTSFALFELDPELRLISIGTGSELPAGYRDLIARRPS